jgi:hypothetical protein
MFVISKRISKTSKGRSYLYKTINGFTWIKGPKKGAKIYTNLASATRQAKKYKGAYVVKIRKWA